MPQSGSPQSAIRSYRPPATPDDLDYDLPPESIAQSPSPQRDTARLLVDASGAISHRRVSDLPQLLAPGDVVVVNDTRVLPARLRLRRATGGAVEVLLLHQRDDGDWEALVRPSKRLRPGEVVVPDTAASPASGAGPTASRRSANVKRPDSAGSPASGTSTGGVEASGTSTGGVEASGAGVSVEIGDDLGEGRRTVRIHAAGRPLMEALDEIGTVPLPPYITSEIEDPDRYQTVYSRRPGSAAAPTAGLHFTEDLLGRVRDAGAEVVAVELAVGLDTFRPITAARLDDHDMHTEHYHVPEEVQTAVARAVRVVAVGTTVVRSLEAWAATGEASGRTGLFIRRPYPWRVVDALMTNFHMPRSTLLCLLDAFVGPRWRELYATALANGYRFLSFGDAMFVSRAEPHQRPPGSR